MSAPRQPLRALGERLAREQDAHLAKSSASVRLRPVAGRNATPIGVRLAATTIVVSFGVILAGVVLLRARPLALTVGGEPAVGGRWITAPANVSVPIRFSDGSEVALDPDSRARVLEVTSRGAHFMLESGTARVSVSPNRDSQWTFSAGPFIVEVKGTRFEIDWTPQEQLFKLRLIEGKVVVSGCALGDARPLLAGETLVASCRADNFQIARTASPDAAGEVSSPSSTASVESQRPPPLPSAHSVIPSAPAPPSLPPGTPGDSWQALARASKFREAFARANAIGFDAELRRADVEDLLILGDVARLSDHSDQAVRAYQRVRARFPGSEAAANAAFSIGRVYFDKLDAFGEAAGWFETYLSERSSGPLAREALGRRMEALSRAGDRAGAVRAAEQYLQQYPKGPHATLASTLRTEPQP